MVPWLIEKEIRIWGVDCVSTDHPMNLPIGRFLGKGAHGHCDRVRKQAEEKFGGKEAVDKLFPDSAYQLTHNALFPKDCMHIENLGGDIGAAELQNRRLILGCFPWKFKGGEAAFCRAVAFVGDWTIWARGRDLPISRRPSCDGESRQGRFPLPSRSPPASSVSPRLNPDAQRDRHAEPQALDDAAELDRRIAAGEISGALCGLTVGIKDVTPVAGLRTTFGSPIYADHVPREDALVVQRLRSAGAVILGKTNCPEFAAGANTFNDVFGRTRNPWDTTKSAGGSTGGGAAALATGMIALAEGTDLGGSLRIPAAFCGVVGLRPSVGLVPTHPTDWVWDTLQVSGPIARTAEDVALMLQAIAGAERLFTLRPADRRTRLRSSSSGGANKEPARRVLRRHRGHRGRCRSRARLPGRGVCAARAGVEVEEIRLDLSRRVSRRFFRFAASGS